MNGSEHFAPAPAPLPDWQAARLATLIDALAGVSVSDAERATLAWLCGFETHTVEHLAAVIRRAWHQAAARASQARDPQVAQLRDDAISRHVEADRYRRQLADLCEFEGVEAGEDPHGALLAHLRRRREPPLHRPRPCPACGTESRAIVDGRCLACRDPRRGQS